MCTYVYQCRCVYRRVSSFHNGLSSTEDQVWCDQGLGFDCSRRRTAQGICPGIEIQSNEIIELLDNVLVAAEFEGLDEMGLEFASPTIFR